MRAVLWRSLGKTFVVYVEDWSGGHKDAAAVMSLAFLGDGGLKTGRFYRAHSADDDQLRGASPRPVERRHHRGAGGRNVADPINSGLLASALTTNLGGEVDVEA